MKSMIENPGFNNQLLEQIRENRAKYKKVSQIAYYSSLESIEQLGIFTKSSCDVECNVVFCYDSEKFAASKKEEILYYIVRTLDEQIPKLKNKFSIAYIHNSLSNFLYFRNVLHLFPESYLAKLKNIYLVHTSLMVKIVEKLSFGAFNQFILAKTEHIENIEQIEAKNKMTLGGDVVTKSKMKLKAEDQVMMPFQQPTKEADLSSVKIIKNKLYGKELAEYHLGLDGIPSVIQNLVVRLYSNPEFLKSEGIMRKSCDVEQLEILENYIMEDTNPELYISQLDNPYVIGGCVKKIFNNLNTPLFSFELYDLIIPYRSDGQLENDVSFVKGLVGKMQTIHRNVLIYMIAFLLKGIVLYQEQNKMSAYNLAVVFGPCFFRPKQYRLQDLMNSGKFSFVVKLLLQQFDEIVGHENAIWAFNLLEKQKMRLRLKDE